MFHQVPERRMHAVRWILTIGWLILIVSLFYDPISSYLTEPSNTWSFLHLDPRLFNSEKCKEVLTVQGKCLVEKPYPLGAEIFWGVVIPCAVIILLVFGHETWRRICPLSFISQIPRALGRQRQRKIVNPRTGAVRYELAKIDKESWLGRNHLYFQFGFLCVGLCIRILFINSDRLFLGTFLILTLLFAVTVGYLFAGKSWCQYFCPMAPVQMVYNGPRGLLGSEAHQGQKQTITQSMCRSVDKEGKEKSVCVSCQSPCIDIDAERNYWDVLDKPGRRLAQYGYVGLVIGFYLYYFLYSGTLKYYYSGAWSHEENQLAQLFNPGFYIFERAIPIPKLVAVPLTIGTCVALSYFLFSRIEKAYKAHRRQIGKPLNQHLVQHRIFAICTFLVFNTYFMFAGRPILKLLPTEVELGFNALVVLVSSLWLYRTLSRSSDVYSRESLANSLRRQLSKLSIDFSKFLEGRSMEDLKPDEVYVLAKVLPSFSQESSWQVYKGMLREALEQGSVDPANSLEGLKQIRLELGIKDEEHFHILTELGVENPDLLDPSKRRSRENQLRLDSYRQALEQQLLDLLEMGVPLRDALQRKNKQIQALKQEYGITAEEQEQLLTGMTDDNSVLLRKAEVLLAQLKDLTVRDQILSNLVPNPQAPVFGLLRSLAIQQKQQIVVHQLLSILEVLGDAPEAERIANTTGILADKVLPDLLQTTGETLPWQKRLSAKVLELLQPPELVSAVEMPIASVLPDDEEPTQLPVTGEATSTAELANRLATVIDVLTELLQDLEPLVQAAALYALAQLDEKQGREQAHQLLTLEKPGDWLVRETAENILDRGNYQHSVTVPTLIARITEMGTVEEKVFQQHIIRVGRSQTNEIVLVDRRVSQHHATLYLDEQGVSIVTSGGAYGLRIGNKRLTDGQVYLNQGDVIRFSIAEEPAIAIHWEKQAVQSEIPTEALGTLDKLLLIFETNLLKSVKPDALIELACQAQLRVYPQAALVCKAGEPSDELLLLVDGEVDVTVQQGETQVVVNTIQGGQTIGEMGVLTRKPRSANVIAKAEKNRTLVIAAKDFETVLRNDSDVSRSLLLDMIGRLQRLTAQVKAQK